MRLGTVKSNRIGLIHSKSDMVGYTIEVKDDLECIFPTKEKVSPCYLSLKDAKSKLKSFGVSKAYMVFDNLHDQVGTHHNDVQSDWMPIDI